MSYDETIWDKKRIWASIKSSCSLGTDEWETEIKVYFGKQEIGNFEEWFEDSLILRGSFDYEEAKEKNDNGSPKSIEDKAIHLKVEDLKKLIKLIEWHKEERHSEIWKGYKK